MLRFEKRPAPEGAESRPGGDWLDELLAIRGIDTPEKAEAFLRPRLENLYDPFLLQDMDKIVSLIREAAANGTRIMVFGDYDADGICAAAILYETLREEGADVTWRLPSRHAEGYGLNEAAVREAARDCGMLITVDCGPLFMHFYIPIYSFNAIKKPIGHLRISYRIMVRLTGLEPACFRTGT